MAETAPLTNAHAHVRKAAEEFRKVQWDQAAEEHQQASADFSRAARGTNDAEALRILKLLEEEHQRLAQIIRNQNNPQELTIDDVPKTKQHSMPTQEGPSKAPAVEKTTTPGTSRPTSTIVTGNRIGTQQRDSSPSLAREIASRRGIPQPSRNASSPAAQARARQLSPESRRRVSSNSSKIAPSLAESQADLLEARKAKKAAEDEGFAKFYSNLTTGTMSKLSSVLAYAGLPLTTEDVAQDQPSKPKSGERTVRAANDPDVKKIFSKAALDAIEDEHRQRGTLGHGFGPAESFYVVQKGGGTYSYADIARAHQRKISGMAPEDEEPEFVDAREVQAATSPRAGRFPSQSSPSTRDAFGNSRTHEELDLENTTLKKTLDEVLSRLAAFEAHAQDASMAEVTQSVANLRTVGGIEADPAMQERLRQLEKQVEEQAEERQKLESLAGKQERMLRKYQSKFEEIKKSAKEKERVKRERAAGVREGEGEEGSVVPDFS